MPYFELVLLKYKDKLISVPFYFVKFISLNHRRKIMSSICIYIYIYYVKRKSRYLTDVLSSQEFDHF